MRQHSIYLTVLFILLLTLPACEKAEQPIILPPPGPASPAQVDMGKEYDKMVYFDFEHNTVVKTSLLASWDLAFEADPGRHHIYLNGGTNVTTYNTHQHDFGGVSALPPNVHFDDWHFDSPDGDTGKTAIGEWTHTGDVTRDEVYLVQFAQGPLKKLKVLSVNGQHYSIQYGDLASQNGTTLSLPKSADYNYTYFSFAGGIVSPEPPKATWDVVFTRYKELVYDNNSGHAIGYPVNGVLLNPCHTAVAADSMHDFAAIDLTAARALPTNTYRNGIGYDWKQYNFSTSHYSVNPKKVYVLHTRNNHIIKLHFLDFYSAATGAQGSPKFESEILE